jgi:MarR family transcriptional regulator, organic hydroperoxide resistance regulator
MPPQQQATSLGGAAVGRGAASAAELAAIIQLVGELEHRLTRRLSEVLAPERVTLAQWRVLARLADGSERSMAELAEVTLLPAATATRLVGGMVLDGLVHRRGDERDRRRVLVRISARGLARHRRIGACIEERRDAILGRSEAARLGRLVDEWASRIAPTVRVRR